MFNFDRGHNGKYDVKDNVTAQVDIIYVVKHLKLCVSPLKVCSLSIKSAFLDLFPTSSRTC